MREFALDDEQLVRRGSEFLYYRAPISASRGHEQRKLVTPDAAMASRLPQVSFQSLFKR